MAGLDQSSQPAVIPGGPGVDPGHDVPPRKGTHRRPRLWLRLLAIVAIVGLVIAGAGIGAALWLQHHYSSNVERFGNPFSALPSASRPAVEATGAVNILLLGSDSRISAGNPNDWKVGAQRTDAIMIAHIPADHAYVTVTSIPRDSWVNVPGHGMNKINAGFSFGGPQLMVQTVENYTHVRIDHVVIADFDGFKKITDDLGGVQITVPKATHWGNTAQNFTAGTHLMDGETALNYVRERHGLPGGDFDRVKRQQNWIRAVVLKSMSKGTLTNPLRLNSVLNALTSSLAVDDNFSVGQMRSLALAMRDVRGSDVTFMTAPVGGTGRSPDGKQDIVLLDDEANAVLWKAVATDKVQAWLDSHPSAALGTTVR